MTAAKHDKESEMIIEKADVDKAMAPLDVVADRIKGARVRDEDKKEINSAVEEVKKSIKEGIIHDIASALGTPPADIQGVTPAKVRPASRKASGKKPASKKVETPVAPEKVITPKKGTGKKLPLDAKGLVKPAVEKPAKSTPAPKAKAEPKVNIAKERAKAEGKQFTPAPAGKTDKWQLRGTSTVMKPTKLVWQIAEDMTKKNPNVARKDILAACAKAGITHYTARTQYQLWRSSSKGGE